MAIDVSIRNRAALLMICVAFATPGCKAVQEFREVSTLANLQALSARLYEIAGTGAAVDQVDFETVVNEYFDRGEDPWGNPIVFIPAFDGESAFLLISTGSDGTLDVAAPEAYFRVARQVAAVEREGQDIVLRGSETVRHGAAK